MTTTRTRLARSRGAAALAVAGLLVSACATDDPLSDPLFWQGVSIGADLVALALILDSDCYTRIDAWGYPYQVCYDDRDYRDRPQRPHRPHRPRDR
ncbi:hypothetical protein [Brevundimonas sp.]|uniref:hypothetical protein n=1 Tax=Brevundimonas sp. TaxID=1871086 RepID=UPI003AF75C82